MRVLYVLLGFLLCLPDGFFSAAELERQEAEAPSGPGPFHRVRAPPVALSEEGEWRGVPDREPIAALVVDFPAAAAQLLTPMDAELSSAATSSTPSPPSIPLPQRFFRKPGSGF